MSINNNNSNSMDFCVNCCQSVGLKDDKGGDELPVDHHNLDSQDISSALSSIYKLNYLSAFTTCNDGDFLIWNSNGSVKLCGDCSSVFTSLFKLYEDFNQLRSLESCLAKDIQKLDDYIQAHQLIQKIKTEPPPFSTHPESNFVSDVPTTEEIYGGSSTKRKRKGHFNSSLKNPEQEIPPASSSFSGGPRVVVQRLENDPEAQAAIVASNQSKSNESRRKCTQINTTTNENVEHLSWDEDDDLGSPLPSTDDEEEEDDDSNFEIDDDDEEEGDGAEKFLEIHMEPEVIEVSSDEDEDETNYKPRSSSVRANNKSRRKTTTTTTTTTRVKKTERRNKEPKKRVAPAKKATSSNSNRTNNSRKGKKISKEEYNKKRKERRLIDYAYRRRKIKVPNPCWCCPLDFPTPAECFQHTMREHYTEGVSFVCEDCSHVTKSKNGLGCHKKHCDSLRPGECLPTYKCEKPECGKSFNTEGELKGHLKRHEFSETNTEMHCVHEGCSYQTKNPYTLKYHVKNQHGIEPVESRTCLECNRTYKTRFLLGLHKKKMHTEKGLERYIQQRPAMLDRQRKRRSRLSKGNETACAECNGMEFFTHLALVHHRKDFHGATSTFVCDSCGKSFGKAEALRYHVTYSHSTTRSFYCDACPKNYKTMGNLKDHYRIAHTQEGKEKHNARIRLRNQRIKARAAMQQAQQQQQQQQNFSAVELPPSFSSSHQLSNSNSHTGDQSTISKVNYNQFSL